MSQLRNKQIKYDSGISFTGGNKLISNVANGISANDAVNLSQLNELETLINGLEWQTSALDYITDNTVAPPTENTGDRYILAADGGTPHINWDGASAGDIVEFDGSAWVATTPTTGTFISVDDDTTLLYYWGGSTWTTKGFEQTTASTGITKVGNDIQLDSSVAGDGLAFNTGVLSIGALDSTIVVGATGIQVGTITTANFADFAGDVESVVFDAANFVDSSTINFDITAGASATANVIDGSIDELKLQGITAGTTGASGDVLKSDGAGGFVWSSDITLTQKRAVTIANSTSGNGATAAADIFGTNVPNSKTIPQVFVNGQLTYVTENTSGDCYFGTSSASAVAFNSLTGTENLYWNGVVAGYDLDASDTIIVHYVV
jgi:hypothetical protein